MLKATLAPIVLISAMSLVSPADAQEASPKERYLQLAFQNLAAHGIKVASEQQPKLEKSLLTLGDSICRFNQTQPGEQLRANIAEKFKQLRLPEGFVESVTKALEESGYCGIVSQAGEVKPVNESERRYLATLVHSLQENELLSASTSFSNQQSGYLLLLGRSVCRNKAKFNDEMDRIAIDLFQKEAVLKAVSAEKATLIYRLIKQTAIAQLCP
jgi:hypothetical protein